MPPGFVRAGLLFLPAACAAAVVGSDSTLDRAEYLFLNRHLDAGNMDAARFIIESVRTRSPQDERGLHL